MKTGKIEKKTHERNYEETHIEWNITGFTLDEQETTLQSPTFFVNGTPWFLELWFDSCELSFLTLYLVSTTLRDYLVEYRFGLKIDDGSVENSFIGTLKGDQEYNEGCNIIELWKHLEDNSFQKYLSDELTIMCTVKHATTLPSVLDKADLISLDTLSEDFRDLFSNKESCDTTLCVKDKEYNVHRAVLTARSDVFAAMFQHDTAEKQTGVVAIPDCEPESFQQFLEYLYCGKLEGISFHTAFHLYNTSDKYDVQKLKAFCVKHLMQCITEENFCDIVILADKYDETELFSVAQDFFNRNLNQILETSEWECLLKDNYRLANKLLKEMSLIRKFIDLNPEL